MIAIKAVARVTAADMEPVIAAVRGAKEASLRLPGCLAYDFFQQDSDHIVTLEVYDASQAVIDHIDQIDFSDLFALIDMMDVEVFGNPEPELRARFEALEKVSIYPSVTDHAVV